MPKNNKESFDSDLDMLLQVGQSDDHIAFSALYSKYLPFIREYMRKYNYHMAAEADLAQEVFLRLWRNRRRFKGASKVQTYLMGIARKVRSEHLKKNNRRGNTVIVSEALVQKVISKCPADELLPQPYVHDVHDDVIRRVRDAFEQLPPRSAMIMELYVMKGLTGDEVARICNCSASRLYARLRHAKKMMWKSINRNEQQQIEPTEEYFVNF